MSKRSLILTILVVVVITAAVIFWPKKKPVTQPAFSAADAVNPQPEGVQALQNNTGVSPKIISAPAATYKPATGIAALSSSVLNWITGGPKTTATTTESGGTSILDFVNNLAVSVTKDWLPNPKLFPLKKGSKGNEVKVLQTFLNADIVYNKKSKSLLTVDGIFGAKTETALKNAIGSTQLTYDVYTKNVGPAVLKMVNK